MRAKRLSLMLLLASVASCARSGGTSAPDASVEAGEDSGFDAGSMVSTDSGTPDAGVFDAGKPDADEPDAGDSGTPPPRCTVIELLPFTVDGGEIDSTAVGMAGDGTAMAVKFGAEQLGLDEYWRAAIMYLDGGVWIHPVMDTDVHAISNAGIVGQTGFSSGVTTNEGFRQAFDGDFEILSDAPILGSNAHGINDDLTAVGTVSGTGAIWHRDGGPGAIYPPPDSGYVHPEFWAINASGVVIGNYDPRVQNQTASFAFTYRDGTWSDLSCPNGCSATAISEKFAGGAGASISGAAPVRWWLDGGHADLMETPLQYFRGRIFAVSDNGLSGGVLGSLSAAVPRDGRAAIWKDTRLVFLADVDAGADGLKIVEVDGLAAVEYVAAAQCYRGEMRVACIMKFACEF